jgi:hypothetical protein
MTDKIFIETGHVPPSGMVFSVEQVTISPHNAEQNGATLLAFGKPYRRVYQDETGFFVIMNGRKTKAYMVEN